MYGSLEGVSSLVPSVGAFDSTSTPTEAHVVTWLEEASVIVNSALVSSGYSAEVDAEAALLPVLSAMTQLYAAANVLQARGLDMLTGGEENRSEQMFSRFYAMLKLLMGGHLEELGILVLAGASTRGRRFRTIQVRRIDGYSAVYEGSTTAYDYPSE